MSHQTPTHPHGPQRLRGLRGLRGLLPLALMLGTALAVAAPMGSAPAVSAAGDPCVGAADDTTFTGSGTANDPYLIRNATELAGLARVTDPAVLSAHFLQTADIDLSACANWLPIGPYDSLKFRGVYDGGDHAITNLRSEQTQRAHGLISWAQDATITRLVLDTATMTSTLGEAGALIGKAMDVTVSAVTAVNVSIDGGPAGRIGALIGDVHSGMTLTDCHVSGSVTAVSYLGGLIGQVNMMGGAQRLDIERCSTAVDINSSAGTAMVGGIIGEVGAGDLRITDVAAYGSISAAGHDVAGLIGSLSTQGGANHATVTRAFATGALTTSLTTGRQAGLVGVIHGGVTIDLVNSYWDLSTTGQQVPVGHTNLSGVSTSAGTGGAATATMKSFAHFDSAGWNITNGSTGSTIWGIVDGQSYPFLLRCGSDLQRCGREALPAPTSGLLPPPPPPPAGNGAEGGTGDSASTTTSDAEGAGDGDDTVDEATSGATDTTAAAGESGASTVPLPATGVLPATGRGNAGWLAVGVALVGIGTVLVRRRRPAL